MNLFSRKIYKEIPTQLSYNIQSFFAHAKRRFRLLHFAGDGHMSFFPENCESAIEEPWDIVEWKSLGNKLAYTVSGCNSGIAQSSTMKWSSTGGGHAVCERCAWQQRPEICNDSKNLEWGRKVQKFCDVIFTETLPALDYASGPKVIREPSTMCLDPWVWRPALPVPNKFRLPRERGELLVYHAMGNYESRAARGRNVKGTPAVVEAIERLQKEGIAVRLVLVTGMKNTEVRYLQRQCDVIVDQLNYGRYGATAREGMMLGKPTLCYINRNEPSREHELASMSELPLVSATEQTIYAVLKELLRNPEQREAIGKASRTYALKWHSAEACADRYEQIYDRFMSGQVGKYPERWGEG